MNVQWVFLIPLRLVSVHLEGHTNMLSFLCAEVCVTHNVCDQLIVHFFWLEMWDCLYKSCLTCQKVQHDISFMCICQIAGLFMFPGIMLRHILKWSGLSRATYLEYWDTRNALLTELLTEIQSYLSAGNVIWVDSSLPLLSYHVGHCISEIF